MGHTVTIFDETLPGTKTKRLTLDCLMKKPRPLDWEAQFAIALDSFGRNGFIVLVNDRQAESLDEAFVVAADAEVSFVRLTPLVGG